MKVELYIYRILLPVFIAFQYFLEKKSGRELQESPGNPSYH